MRVYDLTRPLASNAVVPEYLQPPSLEPLWRHGEQAASIQRLCTATHLGTHMDAPYHFLVDGATVEHIALERCIGPAIVIDVPCAEPRAIGQAELAAAAARAGGVRGGDRVLVRTGWEDRYGSPAFATWPYLSMEAAEWLLKQGMALLGVDTQGVELPPALRLPGPFAFPLHHLLLGAGVPIVEALANLSQVAGRRVMVSIAPLRLVGGDGSPVRAAAWEANDEPTTRERKAQ